MPFREAISIQDVLQLLASPPTLSDSSYAAALCKLIAWVRWPLDLDFQTSGWRIFYICYLAGNIDRQPYIKDSFLSEIKDGQLRILLPAEGSDLPIIQSIWHDKIDLEYIAQSVRFLLSYDPNFSDAKTDRASLAKAHHALYNKFYGKQWYYSRKSFDDVWRRNKPSCAFIAADLLESRSILSLDPSQAEFPDSVYDLISDHHQVTNYLGKVKYITKRLQERMYGSFFKDVPIPTIPESVPAIPVRRSPTDANQHAIMRSYVSR